MTSIASLREAARRHVSALSEVVRVGARRPNRAHVVSLDHKTASERHRRDFVICTIPLSVLNSIRPLSRPPVKERSRPLRRALLPACRSRSIPLRCGRSTSTYGGISWTPRQSRRSGIPSQLLPRQNGVLLGAYISLQAGPEVIRHDSGGATMRRRSLLESVC